uniref:ras-related protein Rab-15-like n=1 Tax=Styela clava TaxID=7725 RepID=UPI001939FF7F|nr:ras-related protein Rab-15-like [Styela clava]
MDKDYDVLFRIMVLGDTGVGKTCLLQRFCDNEFRYSHVCTIGIDFKMKTLVMDGIRTRIQIWDTAGQERYRSITRQYFRKAQGIILTYDTTDESSFLSIRDWAEDIKEFGDKDVNIILAANKSDREDSRQVSIEAGQQLADELKIPFTEVSAYTSENVSEMFATITSLILARYKDEIITSIQERSRISSSESEHDFSEDEGIVKDLDSGKSNANGEIEKPPEYSCCNIL